MTIKTEDFNKPDENPFVSANWNTWMTNKGKITSNSWDSNGSNSGIIWAASNYFFSNSQYGQARIVGSFGASGFPGIIVRGDMGGNGYILRVQSGSTLAIYAYSAGNGTLLQSQSGLTILANDIIKFEVIGTALKGYQNGVLRVSASDNMHGNGQPGLHFVGASSTDRWDDWQGEDLDVASYGQSAFNQFSSAGESNWFNNSAGSNTFNTFSSSGSGSVIYSSSGAGEFASFASNGIAWTANPAVPSRRRVVLSE